VARRHCCPQLANQITREDIDGVVVIVRLALERIFTIQIRPAVERRDETL